MRHFIFLPNRKDLFRAASLYTVVAIVGTTFFFFLHYLGNQLPYDLARHRFAAEFETNRPDPGHAAGFKGKFEYCVISLSVIAGAKRADAAGGLADAVVLKHFAPREGLSDLCPELEEASRVGTDDLRGTHLIARYWWGSKAILALALRFLSVTEFRDLVLMSTYLVYGILAVAIFLLSRKTILVAMPLVVFGAFCSGIRYWTNVGPGPAYAWAVLAAAILAVLIRGRGTRWGSPGAIRLFCFSTGLVSSFLWLGEGHTFLVMTWIGILVYFGFEDRKAKERIRRAVSCIGLYGAGIVACHGLGMLVKFAVIGDKVWWNFWNRLLFVFDVTSRGERTQGLGELLRSFYHMSMGEEYIWLREVGPPAVVLGLIGAVVFGVLKEYGRVGRTTPGGTLARIASIGKSEPAVGMLWIVGLLSANSLQFIIAEDIPFRTARYVFIPHALGVSCVFLALTSLGRRHTWMLGGSLLTGAVLLGLWFSYHPEKMKVRAIIDRSSPIIRSHFDVYLGDGKLIYVRDRCSAADTGTRILLYIFPTDPNNVPHHRRHAEADDLGFFFLNHRLVPDERCIAVRALPDYEIAEIVTGQGHPEEGVLWRNSFAFVDKATFIPKRLIADEIAERSIKYLIDQTPPVIRAPFNVYYGDRKLIYVRDACTAADVTPRFYLHVHPADPTVLPEDRREAGSANRDFAFQDHQLAGLDDRCVAVQTLPDYEIASIHTGQYSPDGILWADGYAGDILPSTPAKLQALKRFRQRVELAEKRGVELAQELIAKTPPIIRAPFNVYYGDHKLIYVRDACTAADVTPRFYLHVHPADPTVLPEDRREAGSANRDFAFQDHQLAGLDDRCVAVQTLPDYEIASIDTGQYSPDGILWADSYAGDILPSTPAKLQAFRQRLELAEKLVVEQAQELIAKTPPIIRAPFNVYYGDHKLIYVRDACTAADVTPRFYLHVHPADPTVLPEDRREAGSANRDFAFQDHQLAGLDDRCVAVQTLPDYEIASIDTGQYSPDGILWADSFSYFQ